jgi:polyhydroxybutyrate depolymerase
MAKHSGFSALADREGFLVLYPNGFGAFGFFQHWNSGHCCGKARRDNFDDVGFVAAAIDDVRSRFSVDRSRVYLVGNSNGGMLTYRFAAERPEMVAAIAIVSATIGGKPAPGQPEWRIPQPRMPVPVLAFHGDADAVVPYAGGGEERHDMAVSESLDVWRHVNGCNGSPVTASLRQGRVVHEVWRGEGCDATVALYTLRQWGHVWPGRHFTEKLAVDDTLRGFDAATIIWTFFRQHRRGRTAF